MNNKTTDKKIAALVKRIRNNDLLALGELMNLKTLSVFATAFNILRDRESAEDVVNEVMIKLIENVHDPSIQNFGAWLNAVALNYSLDTLRKRKRETPTEEALLNLKAETTSTDADTRALERLQVAETLKKMPTESIELLTDKFVLELSINAIAKKRSLTFKQARKRIEDARELFKRIYEKE